MGMELGKGITKDSKALRRGENRTEYLEELIEVVEAGYSTCSPAGESEKRSQRLCYAGK